jgi:hypothetical protein
MSEFKFACPVCGQHITADSSGSGGRIECPTCFQKIVVPQAPASGDSKFILSASQVAKPRPLPTETGPGTAPGRATAGSKLAPVLIGLVVLAAAVGAGVWVFRKQIFKGSATSQQTASETANKPGKAARIVTYPVPTNINWTLDIKEADFPETTVSGNIHGAGFFCERASLQGGNLSLRQGRGWPPDLGLNLVLFARQGEELSGKTIEVTPDRAPPLPHVTLRWKDEQQRAQKQDFRDGYALRVAFGQAANGRMPGKLYLSLPDASKSVIAGSFDAEIRKPPAGKQGKKPGK